MVLRYFFHRVVMRYTIVNLYLITNICLLSMAINTYEGEVILEPWVVRDGLESWQKWQLKMMHTNPVGPPPVGLGRIFNLM